MTFVGEEPVVWKFDEWQDVISLGSATGNFCEDRQHTIVSINGDTNYMAVMDPPIVEINDEYTFFTLNAPDSSYEGIHTVIVEVTLANYPTFNSPLQQSF